MANEILPEGPREYYEAVYVKILDKVAPLPVPQQEGPDEYIQPATSSPVTREKLVG